VTGAEAVHIASVLRLKPGDPVILFDGGGTHYDAFLVSVSKKRVTFRILEPHRFAEPSSTRLTVAQALLKDRKMDLLARQLTELDVFELLPFFSERSIPYPNPTHLENRRLRWQKIILEALKQSGRDIPMHITPPVSFTQLLSLGERYDVRILFWEAETRPLALPHTPENPVSSILAVLGPEGGFSRQEAALAREYGFIPASLGPRILRAETAAVAAAAVIQYGSGNWAFR